MSSESTSKKTSSALSSLPLAHSAPSVTKRQQKHKRRVSADLPPQAKSDAAEREDSERVWNEIHSVLRMSQPDEPVSDWADAPTEFRIGDSSPQPIRSTSADALTPPRMSRSSSTSSTSSAASLPIGALSTSAATSALVRASAPSHPSHDRKTFSISKPINPLTDVCLQFDQRSVGELIRASSAGDFSRVMSIAARPRVGVCCVLAGSLDTPLHAAVANGQFVVVKWLVSAGADCNARNASGATPLHRCAVAASHVAEMAFLLIGAGADPFVRNGSGLLAADLTTSIAIRALLLDAGRLPAVRLRVPRELISKIVGKGGDRLQTLQHRTVTVIKLPPRDSLSDEIFVRGLADGIAAVKEFFIDGIISDGKSLTNVHDVRSPPLPVSVRSDSPLMLTAPEQPLLPTHKRSSSLGCDTLGVPMALEIRSDSEPRTKSRGFAAAAPALDAAGSAAAITDTSTTNSNGIADTGTGTGTTTNSTPTTNSSCNNISSATTATNTTVNTTSNTAVPPSPETSTKKKKRTSAKAAASEADSSHVGDVQTSLSMSNSLSLSDEKFACSSSSDKSVSRSSSGRAFDFEVPAI